MACPLNYIEQFLQKKQNWIIFHQTKLRQKLVSDSPLSPPNEQQRQEMRALLPTLIQKWEVIIGVRVNEWHIRAMKTRWGTCHPLKKRICLNLHLMQKPLICLEYVIVHELVHLLEASHNQRFYALMTQFMPEWKEYKRLLS